MPEERGDQPRVDAVIRVASDEVTFWKRLAIRIIFISLVVVGALAILSSVFTVIVLGRFDQQGEVLGNQSEVLHGQGALASTLDCNRQIQAELNDVQGISSAAFLSGNRAYFDELQTYRQEVTNLQRNVVVGEKCPKLPTRPPPP